MIGEVLQALGLGAVGLFAASEVRATWTGRRSPLQEYAHRRALLRDQRQRRRLRRDDW